MSRINFHRLLAVAVIAFFSHGSVLGQVTNPDGPQVVPIDIGKSSQHSSGGGDAPPSVTSFVVGGVTLKENEMLGENEKNAPVPSGMQAFTLTFDKPLHFTLDPAEGIAIENVALVSFPFGLVDVTATNLTVSADSLTLSGTANMPEGVTYQVFVGSPSAVQAIFPFELADVVEMGQGDGSAQQYFLGTVALPDAVVSGAGRLPEGFLLTDGPDWAVLFESEADVDAGTGEGAEDGDDGEDDPGIVRVAAVAVAESFPQQLFFDFQHVPDGSYQLFLSQEGVDSAGNYVELIVTKELAVVNNTSVQVTLAQSDFVPLPPEEEEVALVTSFVIGGVTLQENEMLLESGKNPPVPSGMQPFEIAFDKPLMGDLDPDEGIVFENMALISYPLGFMDLLKTATNLTVSDDRMKLSGTVNLPQDAIYQVIIGSVADVFPRQQYFFGTVELPDATVFGGGTLPEDFSPQYTYAVLFDASGAVADDEEDLPIVRLASINIAESYPLQLFFRCRHVPDGSYVMHVGAEGVDAEGNPVELMASKPVEVVNGGDVNLPVVFTSTEEVAFSKVRVQRVDVANNLFFIQVEGQEISVDVTDAALINYDLTDLDAIAGLLDDPVAVNREDLVFELSDLMVNDTVSIIGFSVSETEIKALMVMRHGLRSDLDGDRDVDFDDFLIFVAAFGKSGDEVGANPAADLDGDGMVGFSDFLIFVEDFGKSASG